MCADMCADMCLRLCIDMRMCQVFKGVTVLLLTLRMMMYEIVSFGGILCVIFLAFGLAKYVLTDAGDGRHSPMQVRP